MLNESAAVCLALLLGTQPIALGAELEVYAYGNRLSPPYVFAEEAGIVTLNHYPFDPLLEIPRAGLDSASVASMLPIAQVLAPVRRALRLKAADAMTKANSKDEALEVARQVYADSPDVVDAVIASPGIFVTFVAYPSSPLHVSFSPELMRFQASATGRTPSATAKHYRERYARDALQGEFSRALESGGIYAFGRGYRFSRPAAIAGDLRDLIARLLQGAQEIPTSERGNETSPYVTYFLGEVAKSQDIAQVRNEAGLR